MTERQTSSTHHTPAQATLRGSVLEFGRPCRISFQRTLRIPDDGREYPLGVADPWDRRQSDAGQP